MLMNAMTYEDIQKAGANDYVIGSGLLQQIHRKTGIQSLQYRIILLIKIGWKWTLGKIGRAHV